MIKYNVKNHLSYQADSESIYHLNCFISQISHLAIILSPIFFSFYSHKVLFDGIFIEIALIKYPLNMRALPVYLI